MSGKRRYLRASARVNGMSMVDRRYMAAYMMAAAIMTRHAVRIRSSKFASRSDKACASKVCEMSLRSTKLSDRKLSSRIENMPLMEFITPLELCLFGVGGLAASSLELCLLGVGGLAASMMSWWPFA